MAIRIGPIKSHWYYNWGVVLFDFGEMHLEVEKQDTTVHAHSGHYFRKAGEKFLMAINMEVHSNPKLVASIYNNWGYSLSGVGYHQAAIEKYLIAQEYDETVITYQNLGYSLSELEDYKEAMEIYKKIISIDHENVLTLLRYGEVLAKLNDHKVAISKFKHAAELKPKKWRLNQICNAWADSLGKQNIDPETDITYQRICVG